MQFCWNGLRLAGEKSSKSAHLTLHYVYNSGSYNPLARIESFDHPEKQTTDISYYHIALNGLPEEVTDSQGRIIWHGDYSLWGKLKREQLPAPGFRGQQNLRFQGQYFDRETGLHYNTFRYYAPDTGRFTQEDPIGLAGGINLYVYAPNPLTWIDPLGLSTCAVNTLKNARKNDHAISSAQRQQIIDSIDNNKLKSMFSELYRPGANIPDGGTAASILHTKTTGQLVGGSDHVAKGTSYVEALKRLTNGTGKYKGEVLSNSDYSLASYMIGDLKQALGFIL